MFQVRLSASGSSLNDFRSWPRRSYDPHKVTLLRRRRLQLFLRTICGPSPAPIIGVRQFYQWSRDPIGYLTAMYENFGTICGWQERPRVFALDPRTTGSTEGPGLFE
jgi:hypothetical protein